MASRAFCWLLLVVTALPGCRWGAPRAAVPAGKRAFQAWLTLEADPARVDRVELVGELPGTPLALESPRPGEWSGVVEGLVPHRVYRYRFRVHRKDLDRWIEVADPRAWLLDASVERFSLLRAPALAPAREPTRFRPPRLREMVIYELCPRELVAPDVPYAHPAREPQARGPGRVLRRITERIRSGYFDRLGVNTLELMPVMASAWTGSKREAPKRDPWGYLPLSWYALNGDYGSPEDLAELVREAHGRGLAVILDLSLDHGYGGDRHGLLTDLHPAWRKAKAQNPWGLLELDLTRPEVRRFLVGALRRLLEAYGIDGFRMDWTEKVPWQTWAFFVAEIRRIKPDAVLISENPVRDLVARAGFDGTWDFFFQWEAPLLLRRVYTNYDGINRQQVDTQTKLVENLTAWARGPHAPPGTLVRYIESHDLPRIARRRVRWQHGGDALMDVDGDGRTPDWLEHGGLAASRLGATLLLTVPGAPLIFAGQEHGASDDLVWAYDPLDRDHADAATFVHYRQLLGLRRRFDALRSTDLRVLINDTKKHLLVYSRGVDPARSDDDTVVVALNFSGVPLGPVDVKLPGPGPWREVLGGGEHGGSSCSLMLPVDGAAVLVRTSGR
jgi:1,4-alpha-glucan branching enzyme